MAIDKALNRAPLGLDAMGMGADEPALEIEIEDPESVTIGMPGLEIEIEPGNDEDDEFNANLAEKISEDALETLAGELTGDFEDDVGSRKDWMQTYVDGLELLGMRLEVKF